MMRLVHAVALSVALTSHVASYRPGLMEQVASNRHMRPTRCMVAALQSPLGSWLRVQSLTTGKTLICRVTDTVAWRDVPRHLRQGVYLEVGNKNLWDMCGQRAYGQEPPRACTVTIRRMR